MIFLSVFSFYLHNLEEFRAWMAEKGTNSYNKKVLASQYGWGAGGGDSATEWRVLRPLRPWPRSLPPYTPSFPLYTRPSRIGVGRF